MEFDREPLDRLRLDILKNGVTKSVPALHQGWVANMKYVRYESPPNLSSEDLSPAQLITAQEEWLDRTALFQRDLTWFLQLPHHRFWSQIIYDQHSRDFLDSFLARAPRYYDPPNPYLSEEMVDSLLNVARTIFFVHLRMATYKESKSCHITPNEFGSMIYDNFLFDIPKLMDLCVLYHHGNTALLKKITSNIFKCQPKYYEDLASTVPSILSALENVQVNFGLEISEGRHNNINELSAQQFVDNFHFIVDICATLSAFLDIYEPGCVTFHKQGMALRLATFYDLVIPAIHLELRTRIDRNERGVEDLRPKFNLIKSSCLKIFRYMVINCCIQPLLEASDDEGKQAEYIDEFLELMISTLSDISFIRDYASKYPIEEDLDIIAQSRVALDSTRVEYLVQGIELIMREKKVQYENGLEQMIAHEKEAVVKESDGDFIVNESSNLICEGACVSAAIVGIELDSLISQVKDLLPHLGDGFIEVCLDYYNYKTEDVIHVLLEENLPVTLDELDRQMARKATKTVDYVLEDSDTRSSSTNENSILTSRRNIYDNDEFDVFTRDNVDVNQIYKGKRHDRNNIHELLDDKSHVNETKHVYQNYSIVSEEVVDDGIYDDEYDDTYDEHAVGASEPDLIRDELLLRRPFTTPRVLTSGKLEKVRHVIEEDDDDDQEEKPRDCFIANPADIRAANERRRLEKMQRQQPRKKAPADFVRDVKGQAKGRGQTSEVLHNRSYKERHKSARANHNRRAQSDRKRSGGMMPI